MSKINVKVIMGLLAAAIIVAVAVFIWLDIDRREKDAAAAAVASLRAEQLEQQLAIVKKDQETNAKNQIILNDKLTATQNDFQQRVNDLSKHNLGAIGAAHPQMLEDRINKGTTTMFQRLEEETK
ncbi:MAG: hypothetical protein EOP84_02680 [Verrucomicrobiaceae bacterium]|nr:MAG: hypothetical protein EOP84_02680 [Verrucomicrobiaceae bacterium]